MARGCSKDTIFRILHDKGFGYDLVKNELSHEPSLPVEQLDNPLANIDVNLDSEPKTRQLLQQRIFIPNAQKFRSKKIDLFTLDAFLDEAECNTLLALMKRHLYPSQITTQNEKDKHFRTSKTAALSRLNDPLVHDVDVRICSMLGVHPSYAEGLQGHYYEIGEQFKPHLDCFDRLNEQSHIATKGQRTWTVLVYLNEPEQGGGTRFPRLNKTWAPKLGSLLVWNNLDANGDPNPNSLHQGLPVKRGFKAILTQWFRENGNGNVLKKEENEYFPNYTRVGFTKRQIPRRLACQLSSLLPGSGGLIASARPGDMLRLSDALKGKLHSSLKPLCESWCGVPLAPTENALMKLYNKDAMVDLHWDSLDENVVSVIANIDESLRDRWPLTIYDNYYRKHQITLSPGEMLLYEGARLRHGYLTPLRGDFCCNALVRYRPKNKKKIAND